MKNYLLLTALFILISCSATLREQDFRCPNVHIRGDKSYLTQIANYSDNFRIELTGYEGFCYVETKSNRRYAVITPLFSLTRLQDNEDTRADFQFFTETLQGPPEYLGKRSYFASGSVGTNERMSTFSGKPVKVKIPLDDDDFQIDLGLDTSAAEDIYNQRTFAPVAPLPKNTGQGTCGGTPFSSAASAPAAPAVKATPASPVSGQTPITNPAAQPANADADCGCSL